MNKFEWFLLGLALGPSLWSLAKVAWSVFVKILTAVLVERKP